MELIKLLTVVVMGILICILLKTKIPEYSYLLSLAICLIVILVSITDLKQVIQIIKEISESTKLDKSYILILLKMIGVAYTCEFASEISKDAGYGAIAATIEMLGKLSMLVLSAPVLLQVVTMILKLV